MHALSQPRSGARIQPTALAVGMAEKLAEPRKGERRYIAGMPLRLQSSRDELNQISIYILRWTDAKNGTRRNQVRRDRLPLRYAAIMQNHRIGALQIFACRRFEVL